MKNWIKFGLFWGVLMALASIFVTPYLMGQTLNSEQMIVKAILFLIGGIGVGYIMKHFKIIKFKDEENGAQ
ncbi:hypothetical protein [Crocinitomix catalasitica]|uniref:hypothetical protein n=1 Tax=Crocinitomix catalasitica TaxID=184607 RepID=UPI000483DA8F|nr:hypothetical protein [Crocinitomix catalasitica]